jgi:methionine synthase I (cobalamin-dependent)
MSETVSMHDRRTRRTERLPALLLERILVLDGAMGTMIQRHELSEAVFRGVRFADHPSDLRGANDLLVLTQPRIIEEIHAAYLEAGSDIISTNTFNATAVSLADYGLEPIVRELNAAAARLARIAADAFEEREPGRPRFVAGALNLVGGCCGTTPDHIRAIAKRVRGRRRPERHLRPVARRLPGGRAGAHRGRRRPAADRDDLRHPQRQGCHLRRGDAVR